MALKNLTGAYGGFIGQRVNELRTTKLTYSEILENIAHLSSSLEVSQNNIDIRSIAVELAANSILLAELDNSADIKKKTTTSKLLEVKDVKWLETPLKNSGGLVKWLEDHLPSFWLKVFGAELSESECKNIISAHAPECAQHKTKWEAAGIPFNHGSAIFMLKHTSEFGSTEKHFAGMWVINNYERYRSLL